jgi:hypothetical protein
VMHCLRGDGWLMVLQLFLSDPQARFSDSIGWANAGRTGRYAIIIDHGKVTYAQIETEKGAVKVCSCLLLLMGGANWGRFPVRMLFWRICDTVTRVDGDHRVV